MVALNNLVYTTCWVR